MAAVLLLGRASFSLFTQVVRSLFSFYTYCNYAIVVCKGTCKVFLLSFYFVPSSHHLCFAYRFCFVISNMQNPNRVYVYYLKSLRNYGRFFVNASHCVCKKVHYYLSLSVFISLSSLVSIHVARLIFLFFCIQTSEMVNNLKQCCCLVGPAGPGPTHRACISACSVVVTVYW